MAVAELLSQGTMMASQFFAKLVIVIVILLLGFVIGRVLGRFSQKFFHEIELDAMFKRAGVKIALAQVLSHCITYLVYFIAVIWALNILGITTIALNILFGAILLLLIISAVLAMKDLIPNMVAGFAAHRKIKVGDTIFIGRLKGRVKQMTLTETEIATRAGDSIYIPNINLIKKITRVKH